MDLLGKARKLESTIARRFDRAASDAVGAVTREPLEIVHLVVEAVEHEIQPSGRGTRVFPFNSITLSVLASSGEERARFEALLAGDPPFRLHLGNERVQLRGHGIFQGLHSPADRVSA